MKHAVSEWEMKKQHHHAKINTHMLTRNGCMLKTPTFRQTQWKEKGEKMLLTIRAAFSGLLFFFPHIRLRHSCLLRSRAEYISKSLP